jgi:hypothetical protein
MENPIVIEYNGKSYRKAEIIIAIKLYDDLKSGLLGSNLMEETKDEL